MLIPNHDGLCVLLCYRIQLCALAQVRVITLGIMQASFFSPLNLGLFVDPFPHSLFLVYMVNSHGFIFLVGWGFVPCLCIRTFPLGLTAWGVINWASLGIQITSDQ